MKTIEKGSIVRYKEGWYRVRTCFKDHVTLTSVFGDQILHKRVPKTDIVEDESAWREWWTRSETYQSM